MIIPSIDLMGGSTVQLVGGREKALDAGDPRPIADRFGIAGEVAVIDLDAAIGQGQNESLITALLERASCRVGGGIRSVEAAKRWLDAGAAKVILGTAARPEILRELPTSRTIAALDARDGEVVVKGWREGTGESILSRMRDLEGLVGGYLITFVEKEGRLGGTRMDLVPELVKAAGDARVTIAGGITTAKEIAMLHEMGADAQVGMAIYTNALSLGDAIAAPLSSDRPDGLWPTVVVDELGIALGLAYSSAETLRMAVDSGNAVYFSRSRGRPWLKGETSGNTQRLLRIDLDCDADTLRFTVRQSGTGFCHRSTRTCWGDVQGLAGLQERLCRAPQAARSYTRRLLEAPELLRAKLVEEAGELADAATHPDIVHEAADLLYFTLVAMRRSGVTLAQVGAELDRRDRTISRRPGDAKSAKAKEETT
jgi:phosphoribosyl-ATP pyrophosphohydrolase